MPLDAVAIAERSNANSTPLVRRKRIDGRTKTARRIRQLAAEYAARLGHVASNPAVAADIQQLSELQALCGGSTWRCLALRARRSGNSQQNRKPSLPVACGVGRRRSAASAATAKPHPSS
jgi:hypothetical protein